MPSTALAASPVCLRLGQSQEGVKRLSSEELNPLSSPANYSHGAMMLLVSCWFCRVLIHALRKQAWVNTGDAFVVPKDDTTSLWL